MSVDFLFTERVTIDGTTTSKSNTKTADSRVTIDTAVAVGTDTLYALTLDVSQVVGCYIVSDQDITLETNSGGSPADTLALKAGIPYVWYTNKYNTFKFGTDVTALYVTNASGSTANLFAEFLIDPTV